MAEPVPDREARTVKAPHKRRRLLDSSAVVPVPVYSSKVKSSLQLRPTADLFTEGHTGGAAAAADTNDSVWSEFSSRRATAATFALSDSEDSEAEHVKKKADRKAEAVGCPSPPPPLDSPVQEPSQQVKRQISEIDRRLQEVNSLLSPEPEDRTRTRTRSRRRRGPPSPMPEEEQDDDDVIILSPDSDSWSSSVREIPLKVRCRADIHKIPVLSTTPLSEVLVQLGAILNVPLSRLLLQREEVELPSDSSVGELGLGIADIIECVVMAAEDGGGDEAGGSDVITVRLQSKDRDSSQDFFLNRDAPLGSVFSQYLSRMSRTAQRRARFHFDGSKVTPGQTPAQLDMEDGDIIEVWI